MKRASDFQLPSPKKGALVTPPTTPQKSRIKDLTNVLSGALDAPGAKPNVLGASVKQKLYSLASPPTTPTKQKQSSVYSRAKALFQRSSSQEAGDAAGLDAIVDFSLVGRLEEAAFLNQFLVDSITARRSASLYISGPPGTGKTAQVNLSFKMVAARYAHTVRVVKINCMTVSKPENVFHEIYCQLDTSKSSVAYTRKKTSKDLLAYLMGQQPATQEPSSSPSQRGAQPAVLVLLLDELDYLITKDQQVLFQLFNFVSLAKLKTKIVIVSISNALDLTDKFLPRLKSNNLAPEALQFFPYTSDQIREICVFKLRSLLPDQEASDHEDVPAGFIPIIHPAAVQLCCRKSASITGDLRKAFDICYKGIEMLEGELRRQQQQQATTAAAATAYTPANAPKVLISHIARVCATSFGENISTRLNNLNLLQKAILCCLLNLESKRVSGTAASGPASAAAASCFRKVSVNQFFDHYIANTQEISEGIVGTLKKGEFLEIVTALESCSLITIASNGANNSSASAGGVHGANGDFEISNKYIRSNVSYIDVSRMVQDVGILQRILNCH